MNAGHALTFEIGKVAQRTGLTIDAIRFYQKRGIVRSPVRTSSGYRVFTEIEIEDLHFVRRLQALGSSLKEIKDLMALRQTDHSCPQVRDLIERKLKEIRLKIGVMRQVEEQLAQALRKCSRASRAHVDTTCPVLDGIHIDTQRVKR